MYLINRLNFLFELFDIYNLNEGSIYERLIFLKNNTLDVSFELKNRLQTMIYEEAPGKFNTIIVHFLYPDRKEDEIDDVLLESVCLEDLSPSQLLQFVAMIYLSVTFVEKENLILMKYCISVYNVGWTNFAKNCRGVVVDRSSMKIIGHPFDKFFNLNEMDGWKTDDVLEHLKYANEISLTDKKDGSLISLFKYDGEIILNTNGSFESDQVEWAKDLFKSQYSDFWDSIQENQSYIFELVIPENKIVLNYGDIRKLYLLGIRNLETNKFWSYSDLGHLADKYNLDITEQEVFNGLNDLVNKAINLENANKEGWVLRISTSSDDFFVKIKLDEYFKLHRMISRVSFRRVYNNYTLGTLDEFMAEMTEDAKADVTGFIEEIDITREKYFNLCLRQGKKILKSINISIDDIEQDRNKLVMAIKSMNGDEMMGIRNPEKLKFQLSRYCSYKRYLELIKILEESVA